MGIAPVRGSLCKLLMKTLSCRTDGDFGKLRNPRKKGPGKRHGHRLYPRHLPKYRTGQDVGFSRAKILR